MYHEQDTVVIEVSGTQSGRVEAGNMLIALEEATRRTFLDKCYWRIVVTSYRKATFRDEGKEVLLSTEIYALSAHDALHELMARVYGR